MTAKSCRCLLSCLLVLSGCASFSDTFPEVERQILHGQPDKALQLMAQHPAPARDEVLTLLNTGMLQRMQGDYPASNRAFERAKLLIAELAAVSVSEQAGALTVNDTLRSFIGDPHEQVLLHLFMAFNYLDLGELNDARVEAMQVDIRLRQLTQESPDAGYRGDAFARYLSGMIYEALGEWDDAMIAYRMAYQDYLDYRQAYGLEVPLYLQHDLLRLSEQQGLEEELAGYRAQFGIDQWASAKQRRQQGEVIVIINDGLAPLKQEQAIHVYGPKTNQMHRIATPYYVKRRRLLKGMRIRAGERSAEGVLAHDIEAIAVKTLEEQLPGITARALARAVIKSKATDQAQAKDPLAGFIVNVAGLVTERADTRSWSTLPGKIHLARLALPPGRYDLQLDFFGQNGSIMETRNYRDMEITRGGRHFLIAHWLAPGTFYERKRR